MKSNIIFPKFLPREYRRNMIPVKRKEKKTMETVIVTRHPALVDYLKELGLLKGDEKILMHATPEDVRGKRVIGVLPLNLAAEAEEVLEVPLNLPLELRGKELTLDDMRKYAGSVQRYKVIRL